ncbi:MAG: hypothetical protein KF833_12025 [Verrucomicrobiae bacterium]|nr:hypothetical protein [Verrucomicrobiae bacterium]
MKAQEEIPEAIRITMETFVQLLRTDRRRKEELEREIEALRLRERIIGATGDARWISDRFIWPRREELRGVEARLAIVEEKLARLREAWLRPSPTTAWAWVPTDSPSILALVA